MPATAGNHEARRRALALGLARGLTVKDAARAARVSERTAYLWRSEPVFASLVKELQGELFALAVAKLAGMNGKAADRLDALLDSDDEKVVLAASKAALELGRSLRETQDLAERIAALESDRSVRR
jgi:hypothetical protein